MAKRKMSKQLEGLLRLDATIQALARSEPSVRQFLALWGECAGVRAADLKGAEPLTDLLLGMVSEDYDEHAQERLGSYLIELDMEKEALR